MRSGTGDEPSVWAGICVGYRQTRDTAFQLGLGPRWEALAQATAAGTASIYAWRELLADIAELIEAEDDFAGRGNGSPARGPNRTGIGGAGADYGCPGGLCNRAAAFSVLDRAPRCELLGCDMVGPAQARPDAG